MILVVSIKGTESELCLGHHIGLKNSFFFKDCTDLCQV